MSGCKQWQALPPFANWLRVSWWQAMPLVINFNRACWAGDPVRFERLDGATTDAMS